MKAFLKKHAPKSLLSPLLWVNDFFWCVYARLTLTSSSIAKKAVGQVNDYWRERIDDVISSPDNEFIERVPEAGCLTGYHITMHNGVKVCANGYYGSGTLNMLMENKGVHEPQEERVFMEVIEHVPDTCTMLELGAYWGFYSLSLLDKHPEAQCFLIEPIVFNLESGKLNFRLNKRKGHFHRAWISNQVTQRPHAIEVDDFCEENSIDHLNILHADVQESELAMLRGAERMLSNHLIDYVFISTHSNQLHEDCLRILEAHAYSIIASADLDETFSWDGLIVAKRPGISLPDPIHISKKTA